MFAAYAKLRRMDTVEVKILRYSFRFRPLAWREEYGLKFEPGKDRLRTFLAAALVEVSGVAVGSAEDAWRVVDALPDTIVRRTFVVYKGSLPPPRTFQTLGLYRAPEPSRLAARMERAEEETERAMDKVEQEMERRFGRRELEEARAVEREMIRRSGLRGVTPATPDLPGGKA